MSTSHIAPFIESTKNVFSTMLSTAIEFGKPTAVKSVNTRFDISGIVGLSGDLVGCVILSFPAATAVGCVEAFAGMRIEVTDEGFADAIGELTNMIAGSGKSTIKDKSISISCPSVVIGEGHTVQKPSNVLCVGIPCKTPWGEFDLHVCVSERSAAAIAA